MNVENGSSWLDHIPQVVRSPLEILAEHAESLTRKMAGKLVGKVSTVRTDSLTAYDFDAYAPSLKESRRIITVIHASDVYPVVMEWIGLRKTEQVPTIQSPIPRAYKLAEALARVRPREVYETRIISEVGKVWPDTDEWRPIAANQTEFLEKLDQRLRSTAVQGLIASLQVAIHTEETRSRMATTEQSPANSA